jgi:hypothetical protein
VKQERPCAGRSLDTALAQRGRTFRSLCQVESSNQFPINSIDRIYFLRPVFIPAYWHFIATFQRPTVEHTTLTRPVAIFDNEALHKFKALKRMSRNILNRDQSTHQIFWHLACIPIKKNERI